MEACTALVYSASGVTVNEREERFLKLWHLFQVFIVINKHNIQCPSGFDTQKTPQAYCSQSGQILPLH